MEEAKLKEIAEHFDAILKLTTGYSILDAQALGLSSEINTALHTQIGTMIAQSFSTLKSNIDTAMTDPEVQEALKQKIQKPV